MVDLPTRHAVNGNHDGAGDSANHKSKPKRVFFADNVGLKNNTNVMMMGRSRKGKSAKKVAVQVVWGAIASSMKRGNHPEAKIARRTDQ